MADKLTKIIIGAAIEVHKILDILVNDEVVVELKLCELCG